jgi:hypothetical protein
MKRIVVVGVLVFLGVATWHIAESLSSDAIGMALGVIFGVLAGLPAALVTFAAGRRRAQYDDGFDAPRVRGDGPSSYAQQPPVIIVTGGGQLPQNQPVGGQYSGQYGGGRMLEATNWSTGRSERSFTVVGEQEGLVQEW